MEQRLDQIIAIPDDYLCPITQELMEDPVVAADGHSYERPAITEWLQREHRNSPLTGERLNHTNLIPNVRLKAIIQDFKQKLPNIQIEQQIKTDLALQIRLREEIIAQLLNKQDTYERSADKNNITTQALEFERQRNEALQKQVELLQSQMQQMQASMLQMSLQLSQSNSKSTFFSPPSVNLSQSINNNVISSDYHDFKDLSSDPAQLKSLAEKGNSHAQALLGRAYLMGKTMPKNLNEAERWLLLAAKNLDSLPGMWAQGLCYEYGIGVNKNSFQAVSYYLKAATQGYIFAQNSLGTCYSKGLGVEQNFKEAVKWFEKAANQGQVDAQYNLGYCYEKSIGVAKNEKIAVRWYQKAAEQNLADAQYTLGHFYGESIGVNKDEKEAVKWFEKAANQGQVEAQHTLGYCYENGIGVDKDEKEAIKWYEKAAEAGHTDAKSALDRCNNQFSKLAGSFLKSFLS